MPVGLASGAVNDTAPLPIAVRSAAGRIAPVALSIAVGTELAGHVSESVFLTLAVAVGLPHGAFDHKVARRAFAPDHGAGWWRPFLTGYLTLAAVMLFMWWAVPVFALSIFLLLSILHFGNEDAPARASHRTIRIVAHGSIPLVISAACHTDDMERILVILVPGHAHAVTTLLAGPLMLLWVAAVAGTLIVYAARGQADDWAAAADLILVALLFAVASPLIAFSLYFAGIHAPRAFTAAMSTGVIRAGATVLPAVLTMLALAFGVAIFVTCSGSAPEHNAIRSAFLLLSALTVPHMWLAWRARLASGSTPLLPNR